MLVILVRKLPEPVAIQLASQIAQINSQRRNNSATAVDAGVDATLNADLEELSQYVDFKALQQPNGAVTMGGRTFRHAEMKIRWQNSIDFERDPIPVSNGAMTALMPFRRPALT